jgi:ABC-type protease/lipase transport system fused ATPase/permease subunit
VRVRTCLRGLACHSMLPCGDQFQACGAIQCVPCVGVFVSVCVYMHLWICMLACVSVCECVCVCVCTHASRGSLIQECGCLCMHTP